MDEHTITRAITKVFNATSVGDTLVLSKADAMEKNEHEVPLNEFIEQIIKAIWDT
jgi:hypothetical protein